MRTAASVVANPGMSPVPSELAPLVSPQITPINVGTLAGHRLHNCYFGLEFLPKTLEVVFNLGKRVADPDFSQHEWFELAYNLAAIPDINIDQLSHTGLSRLRVALLEKIEQSEKLLLQIRDWSDNQPHEFSDAQVEEIRDLFHERFDNYSQKFSVERYKPDTPVGVSDAVARERFKEAPVKELVTVPFFRGFLISEIGFGMEALRRRAREVLKITEYIEGQPESLLGRIAVKRDESLLNSLLDVGAGLRNGFKFNMTLYPRFNFTPGWIRRTDLAPAVPFVQGRTTVSEQEKPLLERQLDEDTFVKLRGCTHAFIFRYGEFRTVESTQPMCDEVQTYIGNLLVELQDNSERRDSTDELEVLTFTVTTVDGDCRIDKYQPQFSGWLLSWVDSKYQGELDLGRLCAVKTDRCSTLYDLRSQEPIDHEMADANSPNFAFLALEHLVAQHLSSERFPLGCYAMRREWGSKIELDLVARQ